MSKPSAPPPKRPKSLLGPVVAALLIVALILSSLWAIPALMAEVDRGEPGEPMRVVTPPGEAGDLPGVLQAAASSAESPAAQGAEVQNIVDAELTGAVVAATAEPRPLAAAVSQAGAETPAPQPQVFTGRTGVPAGTSDLRTLALGAVGGSALTLLGIAVGYLMGRRTRVPA